MISISLDGLEELARAVEEADRRLAWGLRDAVSAAVEQGVDEARRTHRYIDRTGCLTRSLDGRLLSVSPTEVEGEMSASEDYASFVEDGTHSSKPHPYMKQARTVAKRVLRREVTEAVDDAVRIIVD